ncbi:MAG: oligosaccharide flippase family protein [Pseudomonadota bacterium]
MTSSSDSATAAETGAPTLRQRIQTGGAVVVAGFGFQNILRLISNLILTRLLVPEAFGLMSVAVSFSIWAAMLTDIGIGASVVRSANADKPSFLRTAWVMQIARNVAIGVFILISALVVTGLRSLGIVGEQSIFADPILPWIMVAMGFQVMSTGFTSMNMSLASRRLMMGRLVALEISGQLIAMACTIGFALAGFGVWSLVIGLTASGAFSTVISHFIFPGPKMRPQFDRAFAAEIFHFGKWLIIASSFGFLLNRGDHMILGWLMPGDDFSQYAVAMIWIGAGIGVVQTVITRIFFPGFSEIIREQPEKLKPAYERARAFADGFSILVALGVYFFADEALRLVYPEAFQPVGDYARLLAPAFLFLPYRILHSIVLADGDSRGFSGVTVVSGFVMLLAMPMAYHMLGETAAILVYACISIVGLPTLWRAASKTMKLNTIVEGRLLISAALLLCAMGMGFG